MHKPIILIGGASGCGKTTLAHQLCNALEIDHRLSTGFLRAILRDQKSPQACPALFKSTFRAADPVNVLVGQAQMLARYVQVCIQRAVEEGTSLIIEGNHLIPALYNDTACDLYFIMAAPPPQEHYRRLTGKTHTRRHLSQADLGRARTIAAYLQSEADAFNIPCVPYPGRTEEIVHLLRGKD